MDIPEHDDAIADIVAMTEAVRDDRPADFTILVRNCDKDAVICTLVKFLQVAASNCGLGREGLSDIIAETLTQ